MNKDLKRGKNKSVEMVSESVDKITMDEGIRKVIAVDQDWGATRS